MRKRKQKAMERIGTKMVVVIGGEGKVKVNVNLYSASSWIHL